MCVLCFKSFTIVTYRRRGSTRRRPKYFIVIDLSRKSTTIHNQTTLEVQLNFVLNFLLINIRFVQSYDHRVVVFSANTYSS